jgi:hypothetical protein
MVCCNALPGFKEHTQANLAYVRLSHHDFSSWQKAQGSGTRTVTPQRDSAIDLRVL